MRMDVNISLASNSIPLMQISAFQHKIITMHINISYTMLWIIMRCFFVTEWKLSFIFVCGFKNYSAEDQQNLGNDRHEQWTLRPTCTSMQSGKGVHFHFWFCIVQILCA